MGNDTGMGLLKYESGLALAFLASFSRAHTHKRTSTRTLMSQIGSRQRPRQMKEGVHVNPSAAR